MPRALFASLQPAPSARAAVRWSWAGGVLAAALLALAALPPDVQRAAALAGWATAASQPWRLWTAHLVHWGWAHAALDAVALGLAVMLVEHLHGRGRVWVALAVSAPLLSLGILALEPGLASYRGASGCVVLFGCLGWVGLWRSRRVPAGWLLCLAAGFVLKLALEWQGAATGRALPGAGLPPGVRLAWSAHAVGALLGLLWGLAWPPRGR